jgi:hypothetical protein
MAHFDRCVHYGKQSYEFTPGQRRRADRKLARLSGDRPSPKIRPELRAVTEPKGRPTPRRADVLATRLERRRTAEAARA